MIWGPVKLPACWRRRGPKRGQHDGKPCDAGSASNLAALEDGSNGIDEILQRLKIAALRDGYIPVLVVASAELWISGNTAIAIRAGYAFASLSVSALPAKLRLPDHVKYYAIDKSVARKVQIVAGSCCKVFELNLAAVSAGAAVPERSVLG